MNLLVTFLLSLHKIADHFEVNLVYGDYLVTPLMC